MESPTFLDDGTPSVVAPDSILLRSDEFWQDHLVAHFHRSSPSIAKAFSDLNPIWDNQGRISIRQYSALTFLIFISSEATQKWVLDVGSGKPDLSIIGSALGDPLYTEKLVLVWNPLGIVKVKIDMVLDKAFPSSVRVVDKMGNLAVVGAEYQRVPPKCEKCGDFGHTLLRCYHSVFKAKVSLAPVNDSKKSKVAAPSKPVLVPFSGPVKVVHASESPSLGRTKCMPLLGRVVELGSLAKKGPDGW
ncbi:hypothetical protein EUTSA_v10029233mg [Eutrema salsugineum]|uniref:DUF4283 domain-containing protein n=1 Tax=Eutrema salsugineum TaxID=72664 RepID=V4L863_EUTSA|nr:hypothetical protein EUTSA_v10029233mg [Eutrema salsugineum]